MYYAKTAHGTSPCLDKQDRANGIIVHTLYGSIRFPAVGHGTAAVTFHNIRKLGSPVTIVHNENDSKTAQGTSLSCVIQAGANGIIVHTLYRSIRFPAVVRSKAAVTFHTVR